VTAPKEAVRPARGLTGSLAYIVTATMLVQTVCSMGLMALAFMAPIVAADLDLPSAVVGLQVGFIYLWSVLASPLAGVLVTRYGAARTSQLALVACAASSLAFATGNLTLILLGSALAGAAYSITNPAASHILNARAPARARNTIFALKQSGIPIGWALAGAILPPLALAAGWRAGLIMLAGLMLLVAAALQPARWSWAERVDRASPFPRRYFTLGFDGSRRLAGLAAAGFLFASVQIIALTYLVIALVEESGWTPVAAGGAIAVMQVFGAGGRILLAILADFLKAGLAVIAAIGMGTAATMVLFATALGAGEPTLVVAAVAALGFFSMGWNGLTLAEVARISPDGRVGAMTSRMMIYYYTGSVAGPWLFLALYSGVGSYALAYGVLAVPALAGTAAILLGAQLRRRVSG
jgi:predicted MFS family arabinose efflux permease